jgi:4-hydroxybenzoate polyprenyltransferase
MQDSATLRFLDYFFLTRPTLIFVIWVFILVGAQHNVGEMSGYSLFLLMFQYFCICGSALIINQIHDKEGDAANNKCPVMASEHPGEHKASIFAWVLFIVGILTAFILGWWNTCLTLGFFVLVGIIYNKPPLTSKDHPINGPITLVLAYSILVIQSSSLAGLNMLAQGFFLAMPVCLAGMSISILATLPDRLGDEQCDKLTFAVKYGRDKTWLASIVLMAAASVIAYFQSDNLVALPAMASTIFMLWGLLKEPEDGANFVARWSIFLMALALVPSFPWFGILMLAYYFVSRSYYAKRFDMKYPSLRFRECEGNC